MNMASNNMDDSAISLLRNAPSLLQQLSNKLFLENYWRAALQLHDTATNKLEKICLVGPESAWAGLNRRGSSRSTMPSHITVVEYPDDEDEIKIEGGEESDESDDDETCDSSDQIFDVLVSKWAV
jgi:hypothetical protein